MNERSVVRKFYVFRALLKRLILPIIVVFALDQGLSMGQIGFIAMCGAAISFVFEVPSGSIADVIGHKRALILSMLGSSVAMACYLGGTFEWILLATVLYFGFGTLMTGTSEALFYEQLVHLGKEKDHLRLYGQGKGFATAVSVLFMILAGWLYEQTWYLPFFFGILQYLIAAGIAASFESVPTTISVAKQESVATVFTNFRVAFQTIWNERRLFWLTISTAIIVGTHFGTGDFQQAVLRDLGLTATWIGVLYGIKRVGGVIIQSYTHVFTKALTAPIFVLICSIFGVLHYLLAGTPSIPLVIIGLMIGTASWVGLEVAANHYMNTFIPTGARATTLSTSNLIRTVAQFISIAVFTLLASTHGNAVAYALMGVVLFGATLIPLLALFRAYK